MFTFDEEYSTSKRAQNSPISNESKISTILDYINSGNFENDINKICEERGRTTTTEKVILQRLGKKFPGDIIPNIKFRFLPQETSYDYICGMNYNDLKKMTTMDQNHRTYSNLLLAKEIAERNTTSKN